MKFLLRSILWTLVLQIVIFSWYLVAQDFNNDFPYKNDAIPNAQPDSLKDQIKVGVIDAKWPIQRLLDVFLPDRPARFWTYTLTTYIQYILNLALSIVAFIAAIVLIIGFYGILFGKSQDWIENAQKTVKWAVIALLIMGASWLIVKLLFYVITLLK